MEMRRRRRRSKVTVCNVMYGGGGFSEGWGWVGLVGLVCWKWEGGREGGKDGWIGRWKDR